MINKKTYNNIVQMYSDKIYGYLVKNTRDRSMAEDLTQDTFLQLWKHRKNVQEVAVKAWLFRTAYNLMLNHLKKYNRTSYGDETLESGSRNEQYIDYETKDVLHKVFESLNHEQRTMITLKDVEGYNYQEIADTLEMNLSSVKTKLFRARQKMKELLLQMKKKENFKYL